MSNIFDLFKKIESKNSIPQGPAEYIVACLGNPEAKYDRTRHNVGFMVADRISEKLNFKIDRYKYKSFCGECVISGKKVLFLKPQTYMNLSGEAVKEAVSFFHIPSEKVIVVHDDIAISPGTMRVKRNGSDGGHNGIKNIIAHLGTEQFIRIKIGVGSPANSDEMVNWVLGIPVKEEMELIKNRVDDVLPCIEKIIKEGLEPAMNLYNTKKAK